MALGLWSLGSVASRDRLLSTGGRSSCRSRSGSGMNRSVPISHGSKEPLWYSPQAGRPTPGSPSASRPTATPPVHSFSPRLAGSRAGGLRIGLGGHSTGSAPRNLAGVSARGPIHRFRNVRRNVPDSRAGLEAFLWGFLPGRYAQISVAVPTPAQEKHLGGQ